MKIKTYDDIQVCILQSTHDPLEMIGLASNITMKKDFNEQINPALIKRLIDMNHTSLFEHINYTFLIKGASRSFLAQMTRHRIASYTSGSQHYQNYSECPTIISKKHINDFAFKQYLNDAMENYQSLISQGIPHEEARQILPNAMENNLIVTMNARSLMNFFNLRLCRRNTEEIRVVALKLRELLSLHFPELWEQIGPDCFMTKCKQGKMSCNNPVGDF